MVAAVPIGLLGIEVVETMAAAAAAAELELLAGDFVAVAAAAVDKSAQEINLVIK